MGSTSSKPISKKEVERGWKKVVKQDDHTKSALAFLSKAQHKRRKGREMLSESALMSLISSTATPEGSLSREAFLLLVLRFAQASSPQVGIYPGMELEVGETGSASEPLGVDAVPADASPENGQHTDGDLEDCLITDDGRKPSGIFDDYDVRETKKEEEEGEDDYEEDDGGDYDDDYEEDEEDEELDDERLYRDASDSETNDILSGEWDNLGEEDVSFGISPRDMEDFSSNVPKGEKDCECLNITQVYDCLREEARSAGECFALSAEEAVQILGRLEWQIHRLTEAPDLQRVRLQCGIRPDSSLASKAKLSKSKQYECIICYEENLDSSDIFALPCKHYVCRDCWKMNITVALNDYKPCNIECPHQTCQYVLLGQHVKYLTQDSPKLYRRYQQLIVENYVRLKKKLLFCNNPACDMVIKVCGSLDNQHMDVRCKCGTVFCFNCAGNRITEKSEAHYPATCDMYRQWLNKTEQGVFSFRKKPCPKCKVPIIKCGCPPNRVQCEDMEYCPNQACNHMCCPQCSHHFCWICLKAWSGHDNYYNCTFVLPENVRNQEVISEFAEVFLKFKEYDGNQKSFLSRRKLAEESFEKLREDGKVLLQNNFLLEAVNELASCYHTLKNSYVLKYYNDFSKPQTNVAGISKEVFEYNQSHLEDYTNKLSTKYELELKDLRQVDDVMISDLKNLTRVIKQYRLKLFSTD